MQVYEEYIDNITPYENNAKKHPQTQVEDIAQSIQRFGFVQPIVVDKDNVLIIGHGRLEAAKFLDMETVPCVKVEDLTEEEVRALRIVDNKTNESPWATPILVKELEKIDLRGFNFHFDISEPEDPKFDWFESRERYDNEDEDESEEYLEFKEKFVPKKTTDDCYTPDRIYNVIADWVANEYGLDRSCFVRPFYPGGDYQAMQYAPGAVVVDNPPFSILAEIVRFYTANGIKYFLFAPSLTAISTAAWETSTALICHTKITYENGAQVNTSFWTNLEDPDIKAKCCPELSDLINAADEEEQKSKHVTQRKYAYPNNVVTAAMMGYYTHHHTEFEVRAKDAVRITALDAQKEKGDAIYGGGYLLSERAAAERAAAERWTLSEREKRIIATLGGDTDD